MKSLSITQARRRLGELVRTPEAVEITRRGQRIGEIRGAAPEVPNDHDREMAAALRIRELSDRLAAERKPSKKLGATAAVRALRDHGR